MVAANDGNVLQTSRETGIPEQTISYWKVNSERFREIQERKQSNLADRLESYAHDWLSIAEGKAQNAPFNQLMTGVGIAVDKMQLLRGAPTNINVNLDINGEDIARVLTGMLGDLST